MTRHFKVIQVTKTGQKNAKTSLQIPHPIIKKKSVQFFHADTPAAAAKKAMSLLCKKKQIYGRCSLKIHLREVKFTTKNGQRKAVPVLTKTTSKEKDYIYRLRRIKKKTPDIITFRNDNGNSTEVTFKYDPIIVKSLKH